MLLYAWGGYPICTGIICLLSRFHTTSAPARALPLHSAMHPVPLSHRFLSLALALLVLVASIGLPVQRRTCRVSGRSTAHIAWSLVNPASVLRGSSSQPQQIQHRLESSCYAYSLHLHQLSAPAYASVATKLLPAPPVWLALPAAAHFPTPARQNLTAVAFRSSGLTSKAPPPRPGGRTLLVQVGQWVV